VRQVSVSTLFGYFKEPGTQLFHLVNNVAIFLSIFCVFFCIPSTISFGIMGLAPVKTAAARAGDTPAYLAVKK
jgi:hypothetical protein